MGIPSLFGADETSSLSSEQSRVLIEPLGGTVEIQIHWQMDQGVCASNQVIFYLKRILKGQYLRGQKKLMKYLIKPNCALFLVSPSASLIFLKKRNGIFGFLRTALLNELCCYLPISLSNLIYSTYRIFEVGLFNSFSLPLNFCIFLVLEYNTAKY